MTTALLTAAGFVLAIVLVIVLARSSTARWEAAKRSARAPRLDLVRTPQAPNRNLFRVAGTVARRMTAAARLARPVLTPLKHAAGDLLTAPRHVASRLRPVPRPIGGLRSLPGGGLGRRWPDRRSRARGVPAAPDTGGSPVAERSRASFLRRRAVARPTRRRLLRRAGSPPERERDRSDRTEP